MQAREWIVHKHIKRNQHFCTKPSRRINNSDKLTSTCQIEQCENMSKIIEDQEQMQDRENQPQQIQYQPQQYYHSSNSHAKHFRFQFIYQTFSI